MNNQDQCAKAALPATRAWRVKMFFVSRIRRVYDALRMLFLRLAYRHLMRLSHYFGWHYAPVQGPMPDGESYRWCRWCGMRGAVYDHNKIISEHRINTTPSPAATVSAGVSGECGDK